MNFKSVLLFFCLLTSTLTFGQIKIGTNPQNIDASSVLELESTSRALVLTRVNTTQMNAIIPLQGALVYNTESKCVHYYDGSRWLNICDALTNSVNISLTDNGDGTYTFSDATNKQTQINNLNESLLVEDGNLILRDSAGNIVSIGLQDLNEYTFTTDAIINTFPTIFITQDANGSSFNFEVGIINGENIQDGSIKQADLAGSSVGSAQLRDNSVRNVAMADNAVGSPEIINGSIQPIDIGPGSNNQILSTNGAGTVQWTDLAGLVTAVEVSYDNTNSNLLATNVQGAIDELQIISSDDQKLTGATLDGTNLLTIGIENGTSANVSLSSLEESADIEAVQTNLDTHILADGDLSNTNELNSSFSVNGSNLQLVDNGGILSVPLNTIGSDDQNLTGATLSGTNTLQIDIENGTPVNVSLASLEESIEIATVRTNLDAHIAADGDLSSTNELNSSFAVNGTNLEIIDNGGTLSVPLSSIGSDNQNLTGATLSASNELQIDIENGTSTTVDLSSLEESADITIVQTNLDAHIAADGDLNDQNEIQDLSITGTALTITNNPTPIVIDIAAPEPWRNTDGTPATNSSTSINYLNGNVGIGTNTPDEDLHVDGNMRLDGTFEDKDGDAGTVGQILSSTSTGTDWINPPTIVAMGKVSSAANNLQGATVVDNSNGNYTVTLVPPSTSVDFIIQLTTLNSPEVRNIQVTSQSAGSFTVQISDLSGAPVDSSWYFTVTDF